MNARDSQFILVQALDYGRVIALRLVGVSLCVVLIVCCYVVSSSFPLGTLPSFIQSGGQSPSRFTMRVPSRIYRIILLLGLYERKPS